MSTLIKRPNSPFWIACFDLALPDGSLRRLKKSTKKTKRSEALAEALRLEEVERKRIGSGDDLKSEKAFAILSEAAEAAAKGELSEARARSFIAQLAKCSTGSELKFYTVRQWAESWLGVKSSTSKPSTLRRYKSSIGAFLPWLGEKADVRLEAITKADIRTFRDAIRAGWNPPSSKPKRKLSTAKRTAKTTNHFARDIAGMFRYAVREGLLTASPCLALEALPEDDSVDREIFTMAEVGLLIESADNPAWQQSIYSAKNPNETARAGRCRDWQGMILVGFYAGPRIGDCARLTWQNLNVDAGTLKFIPAKTERKRKHLEVPIHPRLSEWLAFQPCPTEPSAPLFPSLCKTSVSGKSGCLLSLLPS